MDTSDLAKRMKKYEAVPKNVLMRRTPVIMRLDGRAFHTFTRGFNRPFDEVLIDAMQDTMMYLCKNIQGCVLGYTQSDEITLLLIDYKKLESEAWFDYEVQKMCSIAASMATMAFNQYFKQRAESYIQDCATDYETAGLFGEGSYQYEYCGVLQRAIEKGAMFDARCFNIPKEEVTNNFYWRQLDASRNSIQMVGQAYFSHAELMHKSCNDIQDILMTQKDINWNDFPTYQKRGSCCVKEEYFEENENGKQVQYEDGCSDPYEEDCKHGVYKTRWIIDKDIPIFKGEGREYIDRLVFVGE